MTTSNTTVDKKYQEAIQSLKRINNELFYDDLKQLIKEREQAIAELNGEVSQSIEKMKKSMESFPVQVRGQLKEEIIDPQTRLFEASMERFGDNLAAMEQKQSSWQEKYQEYLLKTENLLSGLKELLREDQEFTVGQTDKVLAEVRLLQEQIKEIFADGFKEQAAKMNVKYDAIGERLSTILQEIYVLEESHKAETEQWYQYFQQFQHTQRDAQAKWDEKWKRSEEASAKREKQLKKWLVGLVVGQFVTVGTLVAFLFLR
ncbi:hypothetical protein [Mesobacillus foraminis]|uniref:Uncharacterized protein n=1 Tax=Mesobacillus foraminis TaxID=279826 RepID=A0A4R2BFA5_9BACI|nr:hypothetical protein [Mesobacillus foraminis]TCN25153.1 hypothetical protein EV146_106357 [Mesobacillus foraminis]